MHIKITPRCPQTRGICYSLIAIVLLMKGFTDVQKTAASASGNEANTAGLKDLKEIVLNEIKESNLKETSDMPPNLDFSEPKAWQFLNGLSNSPTFVRNFWHKSPLLLRAKDLTNIDTGEWIPGIFTLEKDLKLIGNTFISGSRTADILRKEGVSADSTWSFSPLKSDQARPTTWEEVEEALKDGTVYFNTAGSLWPTLGALCLMTNAAFGLPANVNIYITPPAKDLSVPLHTDRQDVLVLQTAGAKRWRVFPPPPRKQGVDPLNRGKSGDVLNFDEYKTDDNEMEIVALLDVVLKEGDVLYVPTGFPHTTDTTTVVQDEDDNHNDLSPSDVFKETSIHLTMGLDSHVWGLTYAHLRWSLLQRCGKAFDLNISNDDLYWRAMGTVPVGFLGKDKRRNAEDVKTSQSAFYDMVVLELRQLMIDLEPNRWILSKEDENSPEKDILPDATQFQEVVAYILESHLEPLFKVQDEMFRNVNPKDENTIIKAYHGTQKQNLIMENFGKFSKNKAMENSFKNVRETREVKLNGFSQ